MTAPATRLDGYPYLRLDGDALRANIATMQGWCDARGVGLAPHVKTTMCRPIVELQLAGGATGVTVATVDQARTVLQWGCREIYIANEVVDAHSLEMLHELRAGAPHARIRCFVDSAAGVDAAARVFADGDALEVLVDVGVTGGRTGMRSADDAVRLAEHVARTRGVRLAGTAGFEGLVPNRREDDVLQAVDSHVTRVVEVFVRSQRWYETDRPTFTMGGSAFPDRVIECSAPAADVPGAVRVMRSGCYVTHDHGTYEAVSPVPGLQPALAVRAVVLSVPEPGLAVVGAGRRDLPYDSGLPTVLSATSADGTPRSAPWGAATRIFDHHLVVEGTDALAVADVVELGISHPCSAFDRWPELVVVDGDGNDVGRWSTVFDRGRSR